MPRDTPPLPRDGIYRSILWVLVLSVVAGAAMALLGGLVWRREDVSETGTWIVLVSGGIYLVFRWLGAREARRRTGGPADGAGDGTGDGGA